MSNPKWGAWFCPMGPPLHALVDIFFIFFYTPSMAQTKLSNTHDAIQKRKEEFAEYVGQGLSYLQAGKRVGLTSEDKCRKYAKDPLVQNILKKIHTSNIRALEMTREKVQALVMEAVDMGRTLADPLAIIRGAQELNKMCGFYAPEEKRITLTSEQRRTITQFDGMTDEEVAKVVESGNMAEVIEAEFKEIPEPE